MGIPFLIVYYLFQKPFPSQRKPYGKIRAQVVHPPAAVLENVIFFMDREKVLRLVFLPETDFHPVGKVARPAGGQGAGRIAVNRHLVQDFPVIVSQHFHPVYPAVLMGYGFKGKIRKIQEPMIVNIEISEVIDFFFVDPYFILVQLLYFSPMRGERTVFPYLT